MQNAPFYSDSAGSKMSPFSVEVYGLRLRMSLTEQHGNNAIRRLNVRLTISILHIISVISNNNSFNQNINLCLILFPDCCFDIRRPFLIGDKIDWGLLGFCDTTSSCDSSFCMHAFMQFKKKEIDPADTHCIRSSVTTTLHVVIHFIFSSLMNEYAHSCNANNYWLHKNTYSLSMIDVLLHLLITRLLFRSCAKYSSSSKWHWSLRLAQLQNVTTWAKRTFQWISIIMIQILYFTDYCSFVFSGLFLFGFIVSNRKKDDMKMHCLVLEIRMKIKWKLIGIVKWYVIALAMNPFSDFLHDLGKFKSSIVIDHAAVMDSSLLLSDITVYILCLKTLQTTVLHICLAGFSNYIPSQNHLF